MLKIQQVTKDYYRNKGIFDITLNIEEGSIVGILGRNGSGKTTLLKAVLDLLSLDKGEILLDGKSVKSQYEHVSYICESGSFIAYMSGNEYGRFLQSYYKTFDLEQYLSMLKQFEVDGEGTIKELSKGQQMKVEIAAGLSIDAKLYVLDEPFNALDVYAKEDTIKFLLKKFDEHKIVLLSTHNVEEIEQVIDRCIVIDAGKVVEDINMDELQQEQQEIRDILDKYRPHQES